MRKQKKTFAKFNRAVLGLLALLYLIGWVASSLTRSADAVSNLAGLG